MTHAMDCIITILATNFKKRDAVDTEDIYPNSKNTTKYRPASISVCVRLPSTPSPSKVSRNQGQSVEVGQNLMDRQASKY